MAETTDQTSNGKTGLSDAFRTHFSGDAPITEKAKTSQRRAPGQARHCSVSRVSRC